MGEQDRSGGAASGGEGQSGGAGSGASGGSSREGGTYGSWRPRGELRPSRVRKVRGEGRTQVGRGRPARRWV